LQDLENTVVVLHMRRGGQIHVQPLPYLALTNAHRFVRLAREGRFDGLTFHRWAANFVIQGGSPGANEYSGDAAFSRDEVGSLPHWRGTVGLSTRGHDTGDGQIFVNLTDNVRLDHDYTVYGIVVDGIEVVDEVVEGDVIARAEVRIQN
jgi:cyclophilin family peptidyl-prolyl cis-trans isomerase